jgi:hypothetical protein
MVTLTVGICGSGAGRAMFDRMRVTCDAGRGAKLSTLSLLAGAGIKPGFGMTGRGAALGGGASSCGLRGRDNGNASVGWAAGFSGRAPEIAATPEGTGGVALCVSSENWGGCASGRLAGALTEGINVTCGVRLGALMEGISAAGGG